MSFIGSNANLAQVTQRHGLATHMLRGLGEKGKTNKALGTAVEALFGAIYKDSGNSELR